MVHQMVHQMVRQMVCRAVSHRMRGRRSPRDRDSCQNTLEDSFGRRAFEGCFGSQQDA
ncbi:MAG: hypothetical protein ACI9OB_000244, partial [Nonlabens sp.]